MDKKAAANLVLNYVVHDDRIYHRKQRQELSDKYDEVLSYFSNTKPKTLYRGYSFGYKQKALFKKVLNSARKGYIESNLVSSWSSDAKMSMSFATGIRKYNSYASILISTKAQSNSCIDVSRALDYFTNINAKNEFEFILPPGRISVKFIACFLLFDDIAYINPAMPEINYIRKSSYNMMYDFNDFLQALDEYS